MSFQAKREILRFQSLFRVKKGILFAPLNDKNIIDFTLVPLPHIPKIDLVGKDITSAGGFIHELYGSYGIN